MEEARFIVYMSSINPFKCFWLSTKWAKQVFKSNQIHPPLWLLLLLPTLQWQVVQGELGMCHVSPLSRATPAGSWHVCRMSYDRLSARQGSVTQRGQHSASATAVYSHIRAGQTRGQQSTSPSCPGTEKRVRAAGDATWGVNQLIRPRQFQLTHWFVATSLIIEVVIICMFVFFGVSRSCNNTLGFQNEGQLLFLLCLNVCVFPCTDHAAALLAAIQPGRSAAVQRAAALVQTLTAGPVVAAGTAEQILIRVAAVAGSPSAVRLPVLGTEDTEVREQRSGSRGQGAESGQVPSLNSYSSESFPLV